MLCSGGIYVGGSGKFTFQGNFEKYNTNEILTITSIRSIEEMIASNEDPYEFIYKANGLSREVMEEDLKNGIKIIVFKNSSGDYFYLPENKLGTRPEVSGFKYTHKILGVDLGPLPEDEDLLALKADIMTLVEGRIGIKPSIQIIKASRDEYVSEVLHNSFTAARNLRRVDPGNYYLSLQRCQAQNQLLTDQVAKMDCIIKKKVIVPSVLPPQVLRRYTIRHAD